jgi:hypothetical protein
MAYAGFGISLLLLVGVSIIYGVKGDAHASKIEKQRELVGILDKNVDLAVAKGLSQKLLSLIRNRYELHDTRGSQFFLTANNMKAATWDMMKYKFLMKILGEDKEFLLVFGGSSVTAGHDNYYHQAYPFILDNRISPIFKALGVEMHTHNIAQGANNCSPYQLCYESMGGADPDVVGWEQSYNCGRDDNIFELAARIAGYSKRKAIVYYSASGAWIPNKCDESKDKPPFSDEKWTPADAGLSEWVPGAAEVKKEKDLLTSYADAQLSAQRFANSYQQGGHDYSGVGAHGFNVWEGNPKCKSMKENGDVISHCNGIDAAGGCALRFMSKEASWFGKEDHSGANWHPTRAFHMLRGEAIAWLYTLALLDGIFELERDAAVSGATKEGLLKKYTEKFDTLHKPLPKPRKCQDYYHCQVRPMCFTDFLPHYPSDMSLKDVIVGKTKWKYEAEEFSDWSLQYGYKDSKPYWSAKGERQGEIYVKATVNTVDTVWVCGNIGDSLKYAVLYVDKNVPEDKLVNYTPSDARVKWTNRKYMNGECTALQKMPKGNHVITISTEGMADEHIAGLSHVIMWP